MKKQWLGQVPVAQERRLPFLGQKSERYYCIRTEPNRSQVKLEFEKKGMTCINTWGSPPGIYPGVPECGPDGKPVGCEPPHSPRMSGAHEHRHEMGAGQNCCRVPGTQLRPCFNYNPTTKLCGNLWMDTSNGDLPECVPAPPGYGGAYVAPTQSQGAGGGGGGGGGGPGSCPPGQFWDGRQCRGSIGPMPKIGSSRLGQSGQGWIPPSCAPSATPPTTTPGGGGGGPSNCNIPPEYGPVAGGGASMGHAVFACKGPDGTYTVYSYTDRTKVLFTGVTEECVNTSFGDITMGMPDQCASINNPPPVPTSSAGSTPPSTGGGIPVSNPDASAGGSVPVSNTGTPPPTVGTQPSYESGPPVLPPHQNMTSPAMPTGAWPGAPFPSMPQIQPPIKATAPAPIPQACPLGPVPLAKWSNDCAMSKLRK